MYKIFICLLVLYPCLSVYAQEGSNRQPSGSILGNVLDVNTGKAVPAASIQLLPLAGSRQKRQALDKMGSLRR